MIKNSMAGNFSLKMFQNTSKNNRITIENCTDGKSKQDGRSRNIVALPFVSVQSYLREKEETLITEVARQLLGSLARLTDYFLLGLPRNKMQFAVSFKLVLVPENFSTHLAPKHLNDLSRCRDNNRQGRCNNNGKRILYCWLIRRRKNRWLGVRGSVFAKCNRQFEAFAADFADVLVCGHRRERSRFGNEIIRVDRLSLNVY